MQIDYVGMVEDWLKKKSDLWKTNGRPCPPLIYSAIGLLLDDLKRRREDDPPKPWPP